MLNRRAVFGLPLLTVPSAALPASRQPTIDDDRIASLNPAAAAEVSRRYLDHAGQQIDEIKAAGSKVSADMWACVAVTASMAKGHADQLYEIARLRARRLRR